MIDALLIVVTAKGWLRFIPEPMRKRLALRTLRALMKAQGVPLDGYPDATVEGGVRDFAARVEHPNLAMAASLRDIIRDTRPQP